MTEAEARAKWCPFARSPISIEARGNPLAVGAVNRGFEPHQFTDRTLCLASACMAWRWDGTHVNDPADPKGDLVWSDRSYGHCGLAGAEEPGRASSLENRTAGATA